MAKVILHIDLNAFFARAERLRHPEWGEDPIVVGGESNRGVVSTCNYAARKYGLHSAMPIAEARRLCPRAHFVAPDFAYYSMLSRSFFAYLTRYSSKIEPASIDEGFVDLTKLAKAYSEPLALFQEIQKGLYDELGLMSSLGIAPTKFLAKMASDMKKPMGITILRKRDIPTLLYPLPVDAFWGIGKKSAPLLAKQGIHTIGELAKRLEEGDPFLVSFFGKSYRDIKAEIAGESSDFVDALPSAPKSISHSETLEVDTDEESFLLERIDSLLRLTLDELQETQKKARTVELIAKDSAFRSYTRSKSFEEGTADFETLREALHALYETSFLGKSLRLVGVGLTNLFDPRKETVQMNLWNYEDYERMDETKLLVNKLNAKLKEPSLTTLGKKKEEF